jgi:hypothetical protein
MAITAKEYKSVTPIAPQADKNLEPCECGPISIAKALVMGIAKLTFILLLTTLKLTLSLGVNTRGIQHLLAGTRLSNWINNPKTASEDPKALTITNNDLETPFIHSDHLNSASDESVELRTGSFAQRTYSYRF